MPLKFRTSRWAVPLLAGLLVLITLSLAWPRWLASYRFLPVDRAIERYHTDREVPSHRLLTLIGFAESAIVLHDHYRYHDGLSLLHLLRGLDIDTPALERRPAYRLAEAEAIESVARAPLQPEAWLRIATIRALLRDEPETVIEPWEMSILTGRTHSTLLVPRIGLALPYLGIMGPELRAMLRDQLVLAWNIRPAELVQELRLRDRGLAATRALLGVTDPATLAELEIRLETAR